MFDAVQKRMVSHALVIMLVAFIAGLGLLSSLIGGLELIPGQIIAFTLPGDSGAWARAHVGGITNSMLVMIIALVMPGMGISGPLASRIAWMFIGTAWGFTVFYWAALFAPNRALTFGANKFGDANLAAIIGLLPALVFVVVSLAAVIMLIRVAFGGNKA
jgi:hypothetical protein